MSQSTQEGCGCQGSALQEGWIDLLERYKWDLFATLTFRDFIHPEAAEKRFRLFTSMINKTLYGPRWHKHDEGIYWTLASEYQKRGVLHFHALMGGNNVITLKRLALMDRWNELAGFAKIEAIDNQSAVRRYVTKYVLKEGDLTLGGNLENFVWNKLPGMGLPYLVKDIQR